MVQPAVSPATDGGTKLKIDTGQPTLDVFITQWESSLRLQGVTDEHLVNILRHVRDAINSRGWTWPSQITTAGVRDWLITRKARGNSPKSLNDARASLRQFCEFVRLEGALDLNPVEAVPKLKVKRKPARIVPTEDQVRALIAVAASDWRKKDRWLLYLVAASTGLRMRPLKLLRPEHYHHDIEAGCAWFDLPADLCKNGQPARVWLTRECADALDLHIASTGKTAYLFSGVPKGEHFDRDLRKAGIDKREAAGGPTMSRHSLRHFASNRLRWAQTFSDADRAAQNTHRSLSMTRSVYTDAAHSDLGRKIYTLQPLLPDGFRRPPPKKPPKSGGKGLTERGEVPDTHPGESESSEHHPSNTKHPRSVTDAADSPSAHWNQRGCLASDWIRHDAGPVGPSASNEATGSNPVTPTLMQSDPVLTGALLAQARALEALTNLLSRLLPRELEHGKERPPTTTPH